MCESSGSCVCQLETRAWGSSTDAFNVKWDFHLTSLLPPFCMIERCLKKILSTGSVTLCSDHTSVEKQTLVSSHSVSLGRATMASSKTTGSSKTSRHQKDTHPVSSTKLQDGCMAYFRETLTKKGFSQEVLDILLSLGERKLPVSMKVPGRHGIAGVLSGRLIRFQPL